MNLHLYKVFDLTDINEQGGSPMDYCRVMTDKDLRKEFLWAYNHGKIPHELIDDYKGDPDYKLDGDFTKIGTIIDMINDICNYNVEQYYIVQEIDVEIDLTKGA